MTMMVDIPFEKLEAAKEGKKCTKRSAGGRVCEREVAGKGELCGVHARWKGLEEMTGIPFPDDALAVQEILARTAVLVANNGLYPAKASVILQLCRMMMMNLRRM